jgi:hypothetical protein
MLTVLTTSSVLFGNTTTVWGDAVEKLAGMMTKDDSPNPDDSHSLRIHGREGHPDR